MAIAVIKSVIFRLFLIAFALFWPAFLFSTLINRPSILEKGGISVYTSKCQENVCNMNNSAEKMTIRKSSKCPSYFEKVLRSDLSPWKDGGITKAILDDGARLGASMRVSIVGGKLYLKKLYGHCPQSRAVFTLWGLLKLLEKFPGHVPDVEFLINCKDRPIVNVGSDLASVPPVFSYCRTDKSYDILFPDYSFWGWPEVKIDPWELELQDIALHAEEIAWKDRRSSAFWRGNSRMGRMRKSLLECKLGVEIHDQDWSSKEAFDDSSKLSHQCKNRFNIYVEGAAWSASLKYRMACGSTLLTIASDYYDFFSRALVPDFHYLSIPSNSRKLCQTILEKVQWGNSHPSEARRIGRNGQTFVENELSMEHIYDYMFHLLSMYSKLQRFTPKAPDHMEPLCSQRIRCIASDRSNTMLSNTPAIVRRQPCTL